jgi:hypothetical protein
MEIARGALETRRNEVISLFKERVPMKLFRSKKSTGRFRLLSWSFFLLFFAVAISSPFASRATAILSAEFAEADSEKPAILVGPNMLVSRDGDIPHVELMVAANTTDTKNLVGAAITATQAEGGWACKTYATHNGGDSWQDAVLPEQHLFGGADPQVAFGLHGTAYFSALTNIKDEKGDTRSGVLVFRSEDGGATWLKPANLGYSYDHEVIAVDRTVGKFAGRIYLSVLYGYPVYRIGVFRSDDDGRSFVGPVEAASGGGTIGINTAANILVLSDGTLVIPYEDFEFLPEKRKAVHQSNFWTVSSSDGGLTFSAPHKIGSQEFENSPEAPKLMSFPAFAVDNQSNAYKDRLYSVWTELREHKYRVWFSLSTDRGNTWREPKPIDASVPEWSRQYQPMVAVNRNGVVAITWFDTRASQDNQKFDEYLTASLDGGETLLAPVRVSSESSQYPGDGNLHVSAESWNYKGETRLTFLTAASRWGMGGDYMGLAADANGSFHPFWADSRTGTFLIETASVEVTNGHGSAQEKDGNAPLVTAPALKQTDVTSGIALVFDPTRFNAATGELEMPVRLRNVSDRPIHGPIIATVTAFGSGEGGEDKENSPQILNSENGKFGEGATFDFTPALGDSRRIAPGGVSGAIVWRIRLVKPLRTPDAHVTFSGYIPENK